MKEKIDDVFSEIKDKTDRAARIGVTGGKGGTGKSTVTVLLAKYLLERGNKVLISDCDVEAPNDHLLLNQELKKNEKTIYALYPELIKEKCKKCGLCAKACRSNAIFQPPGKYPVFIKELCSSCGACWIVCPHGAIKKKKEKVGEVFVNEVQDNLWLVTGVAKSGVEETGPVVTEAKNFALEIAKEKGVDYVLLDTAPGIHCPVISALLDTDLAIAVTEPTPMGAHDLKLVLDLCQRLGIPFRIFLNQSDLGDKSMIQDVADSFDIQISREIPHSPELTKAYSQGRMDQFLAHNILD